MSFYRAALAAAAMGDISAALRLVQCSIECGEDAPSAPYLLELLSGVDVFDEDVLIKLRALVDCHEYSKALKLRLPKTASAHVIRGLLLARIGRRRAARSEFARALALDTGNELAKRAIWALTRKLSVVSFDFPGDEVAVVMGQEPGIGSQESIVNEYVNFRV